MTHTTWRRAAGPAAAAFLTGVAFILLMTTQRTAACTALVFIGGIAFGLCLIREWFAEYTRRLTDPSAERLQLQDAIRQYEAARELNATLRDRYAARAAALDARTRQRVDEIHAAAEAHIEAARAALENERAEFMAEAYKQGVLDERAGRIRALPKDTGADLIHLADWRPAAHTTRVSGDSTP